MGDSIESFQTAATPSAMSWMGRIKSYDLPIELAITVDGRDITFDFAGTCDQGPGKSTSRSTPPRPLSVLTEGPFLDPDVPNNQGFWIRSKFLHPKDRW
ncbi:MAG: hypothetical protein CM1200mP20_13070 [Pseudomonadota bacterium]|nr:MAG: hypothetical protein CM1200mP20_13070 [Pseudomonadota bacterium]